MAERKNLFSTKTLTQAESIMNDLINAKSNHIKDNAENKKKNNTLKTTVTRVNNLTTSSFEKDKISTISNIKISSKYIKKTY